MVALLFSIGRKARWLNFIKSLLPTCRFIIITESFMPKIE